MSGGSVLPEETEVFRFQAQNPDDAGMLTWKAIQIHPMAVELNRFLNAAAVIRRQQWNPEQIDRGSVWSQAGRTNSTCAPVCAYLLMSSSQLQRAGFEKAKESETGHDDDQKATQREIYFIGKVVEAARMQRESQVINPL